MNWKKSLIVLILLLTQSTNCFASELPESVEKRIRQTYPNCAIRFDGLIELKDGTQYIPIYPMMPLPIEGKAKIKKTIPRKRVLGQKPDLVLFNNNFAILRIIRKNGKKPTLTNSKIIPDEVKLGLMPQDLLVPHGMVIPPALEVTLGNLDIPIAKEVQDYEKLPLFKEQLDFKQNNIKVQNSKFTGSATILKDKTFVTIDLRSKYLYFINPENGKTFKKIPMPSLPYDIEVSNNQRYLIASCPTANKVVLVDLYNKEVLKELDAKDPRDIEIKKSTGKAYIASTLAKSINIFDFDNMQFEEEIELPNQPTKMQLSSDENFLAYVDKATNILCKIDVKTYPDYLEKKPEMQVISQLSNISYVFKNGDTVLGLNRAGNTLHIYNLKDGTKNKEVKVGEKPTSLQVFNNKIYVVNSKDNSITVLNSSYEVIKTIKLNGEGFISKMKVIPDSNKAIVTFLDKHKFSVINLKNDSYVRSYSLQRTIKDIVIIKK